MTEFVSGLLIISMSATLAFAQNSDQQVNFSHCEVHPSGNVKACLDTGSTYKQGYLIDNKTNRIISGPFGFEPSNSYGGQSPGLSCNKVTFVVTKFGEELAVFDCDGLDLSSNFCGRKHGAFYIKEQNALPARRTAC
ncbi:MAG: hypothetical protein IPK04_09270 [Bdellovibrionales bacterium]|nr:hypothetical protein [Bdellovibrionales bacterium]